MGDIGQIKIRCPHPGCLSTEEKSSVPTLQEEVY